METDPLQSFDPVLDDYAFFMAHSDEVEKDLEAYARFLPKQKATKLEFRILDFGAGAGAFTADFLRQASWPAEHLRLTLVEPGEKARQEAVKRLRTFSHCPIEHFSSLPDTTDESYDLILSNHSLYFVNDLAESIRFFIRHRRTGGHCLLAMSGMENALVQCWAAGFQAIGAPIPYFTGEDLLDVLEKQRVPFQREKVDFTIVFPDSTENRMKILRFLFGPRHEQMPGALLLDFFEPYRDNGFIRIDTGHFIYEID